MVLSLSGHMEPQHPWSILNIILAQMLTYDLFWLEYTTQYAIHDLCSTTLISTHQAGTHISMEAADRLKAPGRSVSERKWIVSVK